MLDINLLPKKLNEICLFKKAEKGCTLYSFGEKFDEREVVIICRLEDFDIQKSFAVSSSALEMAKKIQANDVKVTDKSFIAKGLKGKYASRLLECEPPIVHLPKDKSMPLDIKYLSKASNYVGAGENLILKGVYCDNAGNITATDSFKAYNYEGNLDVEEHKSVVITTEFIKVISENFGLEKCKARFDNQTIVVAKDNIAIVGTLFKGDYPNMEKIFLNAKNGYKVSSIDGNQLLECLNNSKGCETQDKIVLAKLTKNHFNASGDNEYDCDIDMPLENDSEILLNGNNLSKAINTLKEYDNIDMDILFDRDGKKAAMVLFESDNSQEKVLVLGMR